MSDEPPKGEHYVYTLAYPDGKVFYVGKGKNGRIHEHEYQARRGFRSHKCSIIRKIWSEGGEVLKTKRATFEKHEEAIQYEIALIFFMDGLVNQTYGGEGRAGYIVSEETRQKIGNKNKGRPSPTKGKPKWTEEEKQAISDRLKGHAVSEETRQKNGQARKGKATWMKGKTHTEETRRILSEKGKGRIPPNKGKPGRPHTEEHKRHMSEIMKGRPRSEEYRQNISKAHKGLKRSEEARHNITEANRGIAEKKRGLPGKPLSAETKRKMSIAFKGRVPWNKGVPMSEEHKRKVSEARKGKGKGKKQSPDAIAKRVASRKRNAALKGNPTQLQLPDISEAS